MNRSRLRQKPPADILAGLECRLVGLVATFPGSVPTGMEVVSLPSLSALVELNWEEDPRDTPATAKGAQIAVLVSKFKAVGRSARP